MDNEKLLEDLLFENPWLIDWDLKPVINILGDKGIPGKQVRLPNLNNRIDLLFKDSTGRPVIVELKITYLTREHVGQLLEYGGGIRLLSGEDAGRFERE